MIAFGISNTSPYRLVALLRDVDPKLKPKLYIPGHTIEGTLIVNSVKHFATHLDEFNQSDALVFVVDNPVLIEYLKPIRTLDLLKKQSSYSYRFRELTQDILREALQGAEPVEVSHDRVDVIPHLLGHMYTQMEPVYRYLSGVPQGLSLLKEQQRVYQWFVDPSYKVVRTKRAARLNEFFKSDEMQNLKAACLHVQALREQKKPISYEKIAKKTGCSVGDLKHIFKEIYRIKRYADYGEGRDLKDIHAETKAKVKTKT